MTILMSGVNVCTPWRVVMKVVLGWNIHFSIWVSSLTVGVYVAAGGLFSVAFSMKCCNSSLICGSERC